VLVFLRMPLDRTAIEQQLNALGEGPVWWDRRELRDLPAALHADEKILAIALGKLGRPRLLRSSWLIVVTNMRVLCLSSGRRMSRRQLEVAVSQITRVSMRMGPFRARVLVTVPGERYGMLLRRADAYKLMNALSSVVKSRESSLQGPWPGVMFTRVIRHVLALPTVALQPEGQNPPPAPPATSQIDEKRLQLLEDQVQQLQQQVDFLEKLLEERQGIGR
jgi:hypothetical protein